MSKTKIFYRVKNVETGRYYTGKIRYINNPKFDERYKNTYNSWNPADTVGLEGILRYKKFYEQDPRNGLYREINQYRKTFDFGPEELPPWIRYRGCYWDETGKMYDTRKGAELVMSALTKTSKKLRSNKVDFLLNAPAEASKFKLTACKYEIVELSSEDEAKILQPSEADQQKINV